MHQLPPFTGEELRYGELRNSNSEIHDFVCDYLYTHEYVHPYSSGLL